MKDIILRLYQCKQTQEDTRELEIYATFLGVSQDGFECEKIISIKKDGLQALILHIKNKNNNESRIDDSTSGQKSFTVMQEVNLEMRENESIRIFYWNDNDFEPDINDFERCLEKLGVKDAGHLGNILECIIKKKPKEAGNGGVVGITNWP